MKIAIVTNFLYPEGIGGTELYCHQLASALVELGNEVYWFVPNFNKKLTQTEERGIGIRVVKFAAVDDELRSYLSFTKKSFIGEMKTRGIEIAHFHEFGGEDGISPELLPACKIAGIATVITFHLANYICKTGTMHFGAVEPCNGKVILSRCSSCYFFSNRTLYPSVNVTLARLFDPVLNLAIVQSIPRIKKYMAGVSLNSKFISTVIESADMVVSLTNWFREVLSVNGIRENKSMYIPQVSPEINSDLMNSANNSRNNFVFIGRVDKQKGIDLILNIAKRLKNELPGTVIDIYGPSYGPYQPENRIMNQAYPDLEKHDNVKYKGFLSPADVLSVMNKYQAVILPSLVAEMAPLIIMEANTLKVPVIVSDVPGSAELTMQYDCGFVFKYASANDLFNKIKQIKDGNHEFGFKIPVKNSFFQTAKIYEKVYSGVMPRQILN